jgi:hypothetical protein
MFRELPDPRVSRTKDHELIDVLVFAVPEPPRALELAGGIVTLDARGARRRSPGKSGRRTPMTCWP